MDSTIEPVGDASSSHECEAYLLTCGRAWGICLSQKNTFSEELLRVCIPGKSIGTYENLLYRFVILTQAHLAIISGYNELVFVTIPGMFRDFL